MTCIVGLEHDGVVTIGGDSAGTSGHNLTIRADLKVFANGPYVFGFTSSFRMGQILHYGFTPPQPNEIEVRDLDRFMATRFVDAMRTALKAGGYTKTENGVESSGTFLVGIGATLYAIYGDHQVARSRLGFEAVGSGGNVAVGALHVMVGKDWYTPASIVTEALEAAAALNAAVAAPFAMLTTKPYTATASS